MVHTGGTLGMRGGPTEPLSPDAYGQALQEAVPELFSPPMPGEDQVIILAPTEGPRAFDRGLAAKASIPRADKISDALMPALLTKPRFRRRVVVLAAAGR